jgi:predicted MPP superfamily phosphohydrolase
MKSLIFLMPVLYLMGNGYLFYKVWPLVHTLPLWGKIACSILYWLMPFVLIATMALRSMPIPYWLMSTLHHVGSMWMVFLLYMVLLLILFDILSLFISLPKPSVLYAFIGTMVLFLYGYINYRTPHIEKISIALDEKAPLSQPLRIVAISDVHLGYGTGVSQLRTYVRQINEQHPDIILIMGDLIDNSTVPLYQAPFKEALSTLCAPMGIYMVPGNHEYISGIGECRRFLGNTPIHLLCDSVATLPNGVQIVGRDDRSNRHRKSLEELLAQTHDTLPVILLDHQPYGLAHADSLRVDLQLSGHTHHGQIWPLSLLVENMYEQSHGYRKWTHSHIWVSSGLSLWGPPLRIGTDSDFAVIDLLLSTK